MVRGRSQRHLCRGTLTAVESVDSYPAGYVSATHCATVRSDPFRRENELFHFLTR